MRLPLLACLLMALLSPLQFVEATPPDVLPAGERYFATACSRPKAVFEVFANGMIAEGMEHGLCATDLAITLDGRLLVAAANMGSGTSSIYEVDRETGVVTTVAGDIAGNIYGIEIAPVDIVFGSGEIIPANTLVIEADQSPVFYYALDVAAKIVRPLGQLDFAARGRGIAFTADGVLHRLTINGALETIDPSMGLYMQTKMPTSRPALCGLRMFSVHVLTARSDDILVSGCQPFVVRGQESRFPYESLLFGIDSQPSERARFVKVPRLVQGLEALRLWPAIKLLDDLAAALDESPMAADLRETLEVVLDTAYLAADDTRYQDVPRALGALAVFSLMVEQAAAEELEPENAKSLARAAGAAERVLKFQVN